MLLAQVIRRQENNLLEMLVIMYENDEWLSPLTEALDRHGLNYKTCFIHSAALSFKDLIPSSLTKDEKVIKIGDENESLVFVSRCSASAFLRNHIASYQHFRLLLNYLQENSFKVVVRFRMDPSLFFLPSFD